MSHQQKITYYQRGEEEEEDRDMGGGGRENVIATEEIYNILLA